VTQRKRKTISPIDLTNDDEGPHIKKKKTGGEASLHDAGATLPQPDEWRYSNSSLERQEQEGTVKVKPADKRARQARRDEFRKKLLGENSLFIRRRFDATEAVGVIEDDSAEQMLESGAETSDNESDHAFKDLQDMFLRRKGKTKAKSKGNVRAPAALAIHKDRKKVEQLGPSGQTYTPLENQVSISFHQLQPYLIFLMARCYGSKRITKEPYS
jgi:DNA mismatch repair protein MSH3